MARRDRHANDEEGPSHDRWLVSYADFITLMFAFFAVLYATSTKDLEKSKEFQESIKRFLIKAGAFGDSGAQINQGRKENTVIQPPIETFANTKVESVDGLDTVERYVESELSKDERKAFVVDVVADEWGVRLILRSSAIYAKGSDKFSPQAVSFLERIARLAASTKRKVLVEGHVAPGEIGSYRNEWDLSSARAITMVRYIEKKQGVPAKQLAAAAFGDSRPLQQGQDNSRLEIVLLNSDMEL